MNEAAANIPWLPSPEAIARVARHRGCTPEAAELQIVGEGKGGRIKARGVIEDQLVSPLPAAWNGTINLAVATMKPPDVSYEIMNVELCFIDLVAAGLLPAPAEKARWPAEEAIAYLVKGVPLPWGAWQGASASPAEIEQAEIDLGEAILAGVPAQGWHPLERKRKRIPSDHFRDEMIEKKGLPVSVAHRPKVVVRIGGNVGTSPLSRTANYIGPPWSSIEVDSVALRQARARPAKPEPAPPTEPPRIEPAPSSPKLPAQEPPPGEAEQQKPLLLLPDEPQFEEPRKWRPEDVKIWFKEIRRNHPQRPDEHKTEWAQRLYDHMKEDFENPPPWGDAEALRRRLNDPNYD